jgi:cysteine desulfurase
VHSDFVQTFGKMDVDFHKLGVDLAAASGHKFGGPKGTGFMYVKEGTLLTPLCKSSHEFGIRAGTVNVPGVVGLSIAIEDAATEAPEVVKRLTDFRDQLWNHIRTVAPDARVNGAIEKTLPSILNVRFPGCNGESMLLMLSKAGIAVTTASACQSENPEPSHVLTALGIDYLDALSSIRLSMGYSTTQDEIDYFVRVFPEIYERAKGEQNRT